MGFNPFFIFGGVCAVIIGILFYLLTAAKSELKNERELSTARAIAIESYEASIKSANEELEKSAKALKTLNAKNKRDKDEINKIKNQLISEQNSSCLDAINAIY
ncbi:MAG: hypothetical protein SPH77_06420, partial [Campylobacter sp.]|uniref:hypothetical protein n=1 Tax=Campylobacter sp. TaxID=205 RepID=UPI002A914156